MSNPSSPTLKVEFELSETDLAFFRDRLDKARADRADLDESRITAGVADMMSKALAANPPEFVKSRLNQLGPLVGMLDDADWKLEGEDRERVLNALAYFADPEDLIPDSTPGIGYIDDAIMIELVAAGLAPELEAYAEFVRAAIAAGRLSAADIARITIESVKANRFYILPHKGARVSVESRMRDILEDKLPTNPVA